MKHIFLLSPARCDGKRAKVLLSPRAKFALAEQVRSDQGAPIGEVFSFLSGLYFRGKLAYAREFGASSFVITTDRGLMDLEAPVRHADLIAFSCVDLASADVRYTEPLRRDAEALAASVRDETRVVLLGSIATGKYANLLIDVFGERLVFPSDFVGRGDMSRGGLLLRRVSERAELDYEPVVGAVRHGKRPPKLKPLRR